jgi:uncharacterized protein involved in exopolysaccharide biosynthesis
LTPPASLIGTIFRLKPVRNARTRRTIVAVMVLILAVLCVWPRRYTARADLMVNDSGGSLSSLLDGGGGLLSLGGLLGGHQSIESDLTIARSEIVLADVLRGLRGKGLMRHGDSADAEIKLRHKAHLEAVRGNILRITVADHDPNVAKAIVTQYVAAIRDRLSTLNLEQAAQKRGIAENRLRASTVALASAQAALDQFRSENKLAAPETQLGAAVALMTELQARLHAAQTQLQLLQHFATPDNVQVQAARTSVEALQGQIAAARAGQNGGPGPSVGGMTPKITQYENLFRDERFADAEYQIYQKYLATVTVEELSSIINMDVIEPPYVDPARQYNPQALGALALLAFLAVLAEVYAAQHPTAPQRADQP